MPDLRRQRRSVVVLPRRRRRSAIRRVFYSFILLTGCIALAVFGAGLYGYVKFTEPGPLAADKTFQVERGGGVLGIAAELEKAGIISSANVFAAAATATGDRGRLKPGEYLFKQAMSMRDVMGLIVSGKFITYKITIPEGWTTAQALDRLRENDILTGDITLTPAEGQIMPDTYVFQRGETRDSIVRSMMKASQKLMDELWPQRAADTPVKTPAEALILASIIEKETGIPEERSRVASVFANRLRQGMRLQSDPTIIYGITGGKMKLDRALTKADIAQATPYNTYRINGLPPGPIANPGRAALQAALAPAQTNDLYFVADGSGGHVFAATLAEHRVNVQKWRVIEKERNREEAPVMDEDVATGDAVAAAPGPAPEPEPAQTTQEASLPPVADIEAAAQDAGNPLPPTTESGQDEAAQSGQEAAGEPRQAGQAPIPRPKPDWLLPSTAGSDTTTSDATTVAEVALDLKPGSVIRGAKRLIPIPAPKPQSP